jgi:hypothetical protein
MSLIQVGMPIAYLNNTNVRVDVPNSQMYDASGGLAVDWTNRKLNYSGGGLTVDWENSKLYDGGGNVSFDWVNAQIFWSSTLVADFVACQLTDQSGNDNTTLDWHNCILYDNSANNYTSVDWNNRKLQDSSDNLSIDWTNRKHYYSGGTSVAIDLGAATIYDSGGNPSVQWNAYWLVFDGTLMVDWGNEQLSDGNGTGNVVLDWHYCYLKDNSANVTSVDWNNRTLNNSSGTPIMGFSSGIGFFGATPVGQQTGGAKTAGATYGTNEQNMLQIAYNALRAFGLLS